MVMPAYGPEGDTANADDFPVLWHTHSMYYREHHPPHFHADYSGHKAEIAIADGKVIAGSLPPRALRLVRQWLERHRRELSANWRRARRNESLAPIEALE
jgi:hypothetical protein